MPKSIVAHRRGMLLSLSIAAVAAVDPALPALSPTGGWLVDYAEHQCTAQREFSTSKGPVALIIKPSPTSDVVQLNWVENRPGGIADETEAKLAIGLAEPVKVRQLTFGGKKHTIRQINLPPEIAAPLSTAANIRWVGRGANAELKTGSLKKVMETLAACRTDLRRYWNIEQELRDKLQSQASTPRSFVSLFSYRDYPAQSLDKDDSGIASVIVLINEKGRVSECMLDATSGFASLDAMTCAIIRERAKFEPAIGADGKPARSAYVQRVRWELP